MTTAAPSKIDRRMLVRVPVHVGTFLDLICTCGGVSKRLLMATIMAAGMQQVFAIDPKRLAERKFVIPQQASLQRHPDLKELARLICGDE